MRSRCTSSFIGSTWRKTAVTTTPAAIFTEDAVHDHSIDGRVEGAEAIVESRAQLAQGFDDIAITLETS